MSSLRKVVILLVIAAAAALAGFLWWQNVRDGLPDGIASGNGRIEAVEIDVAAKTAGRVEEIQVNEGDFVTAGQVLARMDTASLDAQLREAEAKLRQALVGVDTAQSQVKQRDAELDAAQAVVRQQEAELEAARKQLARTGELVGRGTAPQQKLDEDRARFEGARAAVSAANAQVAAARAAHGYSEAQVIASKAAVEAARATIERIKADIGDSVLKSPRDGRVQYRVAQPGEVLSAGGVVVNMVDLTDVYMTFFLPTDQAGRTAIGAEARIVLDAAPQYVIPAAVSFVADVAQFTPKTVETAEERQKLMFRIKARIAPEILRKYIHQVKTGLPGMVYVRLGGAADWPEHLRVKLPE